MSLYYRIVAGILWLLTTACLCVAVYFLFVALYALYAMFFVPDSNGIGIVVVFAGMGAGFLAMFSAPFFYITTRAFYFDFKKDDRAEETFQTVHKWLLMGIAAGIAYLLWWGFARFVFV